MVSADDVRKAIPHALGETHLPLPERQSGKVRDWYSLPGGKRLLVTTDRLSAFDRVLAQLPFKGQVLNQLTAWWFDQTRDIIPNHMMSLPDPNAVVAMVAKPFPVEVVVRGYITGVTGTALWYRYSLGERDIYGYKFPEGLRKNAALQTPIITPTTKDGPTGHDERLTCAEVVDKGFLDKATWEQVMAKALAIFQRGQTAAAKAGLILVDTKYELGRLEDGTVILIDEVHTPDSSRFWKADSYLAAFAAGKEPENYDKEIVRLAYAEKGYRGDGTPPELSEEIWVAASQRYVNIYEMLTGLTFEPGAYPAEARITENLKAAGLI
jgi:phosphoribosylaminoimidazole-succinocarboxamide synthase